MVGIAASFTKPRRFRKRGRTLNRKRKENRLSRVEAGKYPAQTGRNTNHRFRKQSWTEKPGQRLSLAGEGRKAVRAATRRTKRLRNGMVSWNGPGSRRRDASDHRSVEQENQERPIRRHVRDGHARGARKNEPPAPAPLPIAP